MKIDRTRNIPVCTKRVNVGGTYKYIYFSTDIQSPSYSNGRILGTLGKMMIIISVINKFAVAKVICVVAAK